LARLNGILLDMVPDIPTDISTDRPTDIPPHFTVIVMTSDITGGLCGT
jgi:hypothetical protein